MIRRSANAREKNQRGVTLVETALGLAVMAVAMAALTQLMVDNANLARAKAAADRLNEVAEASEAYIRANWNTLLTTATAGAPIVIPAGRASATAIPPSGPGGLPSLQGGNFLPQTFIDTNAFGQRHALLIRQPVPNQIEAMVVTYSGSTIPDHTLAKIPSMIGGKGGAMLSNPLTGTTGQVMGVQGGWQTAATTWSSSWAGGTTTPTTGRIMATLGFETWGVTQPYLYRDNLGDPTLNRMNTAIDMGGNNLNNTNAVNAATVTTSSHATVGGNLTVASGYAYVGSATVVGDMNVGGDVVVGGNETILGGLAVAGGASVAGDVVANDFLIGSMGNQPLSKAVMGSGIYAPDATVAKPTCKTGQSPQIFVMPAWFSDNGTGSVLSSAQAWAESINSTTWRVRMRVRNTDGWVTPNSTYGGVVAMTKCN